MKFWTKIETNIMSKYASRCFDSPRTNVPLVENEELPEFRPVELLVEIDHEK